MKKAFKKPLVTALALCASVGVASAASVYDNHGAKLDFGFEAGYGTFTVLDANFGGGQDFDPTTKTDKQDVDWQEFYIKPKLTGSYNLAGTSIYGEWSIIGEKTMGDGDALGTTANGDEHIDNETAYLGWKSGNLLSALGENVIDIYAGQAPVVMGESFVLGDGSYDGDSNVGGAHPAFWLAPHSSFERAAVLKVNTSPVRGDLFFISTDETHFNTKGFGANVEGTIGSFGTVGAMLLKLTDSDRDSRDSMRVIEARYMGNPLATVVENIYLNLEYSNESNTESVADVKAYAYAAELGYNCQCPASPTVAYRYSFYSGDDASTKENEKYDPLFQKGFARGWGTWLEGEIMGEYYYSNSNKTSHTVMLKAKPVDSVAMGLIGYRFNAQEVAKGEDKHMADELNIYADWTVNGNLFISAAAGRAWPGDNLKDQGFDKATDVLELYAIVTF